MSMKKGLVLRHEVNHNLESRNICPIFILTFPVTKRLGTDVD